MTQWWQTQFVPKVVGWFETPQQKLEKETRAILLSRSPEIAPWNSHQLIVVDAIANLLNVPRDQLCPEDLLGEYFWAFRTEESARTVGKGFIVLFDDLEWWMLKNITNTMWPLEFHGLNEDQMIDLLAPMTLAKFVNLVAPCVLEKRPIFLSRIGSAIRLRIRGEQVDRSRH